MGPRIGYILVGRGSRTFARYSQCPAFVPTDREQRQCVRRAVGPTMCHVQTDIAAKSGLYLRVALGGLNMRWAYRGSARLSVLFTTGPDEPWALRTPGERSGASPHQSVSDPGCPSAHSPPSLLRFGLRHNSAIAGWGRFLNFRFNGSSDGWPALFSSQMEDQVCL
jgi:hypothetical protein